MGKTIETRLALTPDHLIALGILGNAWEPVHYMKFVELNPKIFGAVVELTDRGLAKKVNPEPRDEENTHYELSNKGREYLERILKLL